MTNANVWSHDGRWIYYDVRSADHRFDGDRIERVDHQTGEVQVIFQARDDAKVGVVTASPTDDRIAFIHGPSRPTSDWRYSACHRRGIVMTPGQPDSVLNLDARDLVPPFTPGALRGGSHVHVFCADGRSISYTYEDHVLDVADDERCERNQRNVGVSIPIRRIAVPKTHPRNHDGEFFSFLATRTHDRPEPGSDQISRAYEDAWLPSTYRSNDDPESSGAFAFIGDVMTVQGKSVPELFLCQLPADCCMAGEGPLEGTPTTRPRPPKGTLQRRLTRTTDRVFPGLACDVRHWPRSSPDGRQIAFLMRDDAGVVQIWLTSPDGESLRQLTDGQHGIASSFTFRSDGRAIACVISNAVGEVDTQTGQITSLTDPDCEHPPQGTAVVYSANGDYVAYTRSTRRHSNQTAQVHVVETTRSSLTG
ncbi:DUF3748 domain-containing protein [Neorhodopirellula pilleata]|uniref:DUF3748 domain-containing protein n=1 Tax=Neorhodopirellula pilleata TaxID=2714738 RepID=UPI001E366F5B|nr:DUF3748 domain-containing protein [Neorhodopirellula pilleata]